MTILEFANVRKDHPGTPPVTALREVSLTVAEGEFVAITGPSGSGKSTLLTLAGTLERPTSGEIRIAGIAVARLAEHELSALRAQRIGFVFQQFFLLPALSALENVATGLLYRRLPAAQRRQLAAEALEAVRLSHRAGHRPSELSGGERQRVAIARAIVGRPAVVVADEPTGNLDSATGAGIIALLTELNRAGATIVVATHDSDVASAAARVIRLRDGAVQPGPGETT